MKKTERETKESIPFTTATQIIKHLGINLSKESLWHCTGHRFQEHPHGKEIQKSKMAVWGGLTNSCEKKRGEKQRKKGKI